MTLLPTLILTLCSHQRKGLSLIARPPVSGTGDTGVGTGANSPRIRPPLLLAEVNAGRAQKVQLPQRLVRGRGWGGVSEPGTCGETRLMTPDRITGTPIHPLPPHPRPPPGPVPKAHFSAIVLESTQILSYATAALTHHPVGIQPQDWASPPSPSAGVSPLILEPRGESMIPECRGESPDTQVQRRDPPNP